MNRAVKYLAPLVLALASACGDYGDINEPQPEASIDAQLRDAIGTWGVVPIGPVAPVDPALLELGRALMFDKILSGNRDVSCATCHDPSLNLTDGRSLAVGTGAAVTAGVRSLGPGRQFAVRSSPSLINQGLRSYVLFWDGRVSGFGTGPFSGPDSSIQLPNGLNSIIAAQAMLPVVSRQEMRGNPGDVDRFGNPNELAAIPDNQPAQVWSSVMARVLGIPEYASMFRAAFPTAPTFDFRHAAMAIAAFETAAYTRTNSPFDRFLAQDNGAMTLEQKEGALLFFGRARCSQCHNGPLIGGQDFANVAVPQVGPGSGTAAPLDLGRGALPGFEHGFYRFAFRAPPLRNVELTAPYFHNGAFESLDAVVNHYSDVRESIRAYDPAAHLDPQFRSLHHGDAATINDVLSNVDFRLSEPLNLTPQDKRQIVAFLKSLTDPSARDLGAVVPASVPSGLPVRD